MRIAEHNDHFYLHMELFKLKREVKETLKRNWGGGMGILLLLIQLR